ncbi:hypothetical protein BGZ73_008950 [Actinomortierella ambigua]|nr:hypothetical protein BGZ73_008950 [Actinomortierella ambigua]
MASTPTDRQSPSTDTQHAAATAHLPHYFHPPRSASTSSGEPTPKASSSTSHVQWRSESSVPTTASSNSTWRTQAPILPESIPLPIKDQVPPSPSTAPSASTSSISISESSATSASSDSKSPTVHTSTCLPSAAPIHSAPDALPPSAASQDFSAQVPGHAHTSSAAPVVTDRSPAPLQFGDHSLPYSPTLFDLKHALSLDKNRMTQGSSKAILDFVHCLRTEPKVLARAFANLQSQELDHLTIPERPVSTIQSAATATGGSMASMTSLPSSKVGQATLSRGFSGASTKPPSARERSNSLFMQGSLGSQSSVFGSSTKHSHGSPVSTQSRSQSSAQGASTTLGQGSDSTIPNFMNNHDVVHIILENLFGPSSFESETRLRRDLVATIIAELLAERKGDNRLIGEFLERYLTLADWQHSSRAKAKFEVMILDILQRGDKALDGYSDQELNAEMSTSTLPATKASLAFAAPHHAGHGDSAAGTGRTDDSISRKIGEPLGRKENLPPMLPRLTTRQSKVEEFFTEACLEILECLREHFPPSLLQLIHAIFERVDDDKHGYATLVIITKFVFYRFMNKCIAYPETYGLVQDNFITERQRQRTLFTTHQRLYRSVTMILNPLPGWTPVAAQASQSPGSSAVTRSNSFGGGRPQRHRTTSETPPLATRAAVNAASVNHPTEVPQTSRVHKRSSASFSFFGGASFKSKPPPPTTTLEKTKGSNATADANGGTSSTFTSSSASTGHYLAGPSPTLSAVRTGSTVQPQMATIEVTTTTRIGIHPETGIATCPTTRATVVQTSSPQESSILRSMEGLTQEEPVRSASPTPIAAPPEDWANEELLRAMKTALQELKTMYPGPIKEAPWSLYKASFDALQEPWALVYVQYPSSSRKRQSIRSGVHGSLTADQILTPVGLTMAPPCMAMVMENSALGARPRNVTVTTPVLVDQGMDSAGNPEGGLSEGLVVDLDLDVDVSDTDSILMPEDASSHSMTSSASFGVTVRLTHDDHHGHMDWSGTRSSRTHGQDIFRTDSSHTLSSLGNGTSSSLHPPLSSSSSSSYPRAPASNGSTRRHRDASPMTPQRSKEMDLLWRQRMQQRVRSEFDLPEDIRTVAKAVFRVLREFDVVMPMNVAWFDPGRASWKDGEDGRGGRMSIRSLLLRAMDQARLYGSHAAAISIHHALSILEASPILQALDDSKLVFLLALPIYHRLQHRSERMRARILWESYAHGWHQRVLSAIERRREDLSSLRIKMYYQTCVRPSRAFERSSAVVQVLSRLNHEILQKYMTAEELECERQRLVPSSRQPDQESTQQLHQVSFLESQMREKDRERDRELEKTKKLSSSYTPSQHGSHLLNQYYHVQEPQGTSRHQPLNRAGSRHSLGSHAAGSGPRGWPTMFDKDTSSSLSSTLGTSSPPTVPPVTDFVMDAREASAAKKWIQDTGINDFMPGEDNFHRFCMEVELVVRGIGLGGTGIQDAGIPQATQGQPSASLHSSGSDFFVKEVTRFNGSFVPGMGPAPELLASAGGGLGSSSSLSTMSSAPSTPTVSTFASAKSSAAVGVAEYLVNSFKGSSSQGTPQAGGGISGVSTLLQGAGGAGSSLSSAANSTKSRLRIRKVAPTLHLASDDRPTSQVDGNHPLLGETDDSIFAAPNPGPTYLLYNPPFASATAGPSSSYSSSATPGNMSLVSLPHQMGQPIKDLDDLLLKIQLKLTSFVLSEWLDLFGGVETDRWFAEFMEDMMLSKGQTESESVDGCDHLPPSSASSVSSSASSSRGVAAASSSQQQPLLTPLLQSTLSMSTGVSATASSAGSTSRGGRGGVRGPSLIVGTHADETAGLSSSLGTMSRTSSSLSNVSAEGCFTMSDVDATYHGSGSSGRSSGAYGDMHDTLVASGGASRFSTTATTAASFVPVKDERLGAYDIDEAFRTTIAQMEQVKSPYQKLVHLFSLELLVVASLSYPSSCVGGAGTRSASQSKLSKSIFESMHSISGITSEDEVDDDGREHQQKSARQKRHHRPVPKSYTPGTDAIVNAIEKLFRMPSPFRPQNLFRDMQLIATFVPGSILDLRDDGKAFWDMALAVTSLKQEVVKHLVKRGLELVETEEMAAERPGNSSGSGRGGTGYGYARNDEEERLRMREAVRLFTIGASESSPVAQRELAILYMSLPAIPSNAPRSARYTRAPGGRPQYHLQQQRTQHPHQYQHGQSPAKSASPSGASTFRFMRTGSGGGVGGGSSSTPSSPQSLSTPTMAQGAAALSLSSSVPIKHSGGGGSGRYLQHRHSGSGSGGIGGTASSFTGNVLSGLGIMAGLGSFASGSGGGGRDSSASVETSGGLSSAGSHVGSTTGSFDSSSAVGAADPASTHGAEDHDHLHPSSATYSAMRPCTCGSDLSSYGRHFIGQAAEGQGSHPGRAGDGRSSGLCPHHHNHHRHTSSNSSSSSTGSYERDRSSHGRHSQQHYHEPPGSSSSTRSPGLEKFNPENVAAAMHWFTLAAAHGDKFSIEYLKHRDLTNGMHE